MTRIDHMMLDLFALEYKRGASAMAMIFALALLDRCRS